MSRNITLDYQRQPVSRAAMPRWMRVCFAAGAVPGVIVPWLWFAWDTSPWMVVRAFVDPGFNVFSGILLALAAPFFLALPIFVWKLRLVVATKSRLWERLAVWTVGGLGLALTCVFLAYLMGNLNLESLPMFVGPLVVLGVGTVALVWLLRMRAPAESVATLTMYVPYLANGAICLWGFHDKPDVGWYVTLGVCGIMLVEVVWTVVWEIGNKAHILEA